MTDLQPLDDALSSTLARLGLGPVELILALTDEWKDIAGDPWTGNSRPVLIRNGELLIEADPPSTVRVLSYASGDLLRRLDGRFGVGAVERIRVVAKRRE